MTRRMVLPTACIAILAIVGVAGAATISMADWEADPVQSIGDLTFTLADYSIGSNIMVEFWDYGAPFGSGVTFSNFPANGSVEYTVAINQTVAPGWWIDSVDLSYYDEGPNQNGVMTKLIVEENVTLGRGQSYDVPDGVSSLTIEDTFTNIVGSGSNQFHTVIPEPATLGLLALGTVGMIRRRRRA